MPNLQDPNFSRTVTYICEHGEHGAMGIVLNRPTDLRLADVLRHMEIEGGLGRRWRADRGISVVPVEEERGFVCAAAIPRRGARRWRSTTISASRPRDILEAMARGDGPGPHWLHSVTPAGRPASWNARWHNAWLSGPADQSILFELPAERRWEAAARLLGGRCQPVEQRGRTRLMAVMLGFDYGTHKIGVAVGQAPDGTATPLTTLGMVDRKPDWQRISDLRAEGIRARWWWVIRSRND